MIFAAELNVKQIQKKIAVPVKKHCAEQSKNFKKSMPLKMNALDLSIGTNMSCLTFILANFVTIYMFSLWMRRTSCLRTPRFELGIVLSKLDFFSETDIIFESAPAWLKAAFRTAKLLS